MSDHGADRRLPDRPHHAQQTGGARLFTAIAHVFLYLVLTALIVDVSPPERQERVVGVFSAFMLAGQAGGAAGLGHPTGWAMAPCLAS